MEIKKVEEERVLEMIDKATKVEDLIELERRLGQLRTDIELYQSQLDNIDRLTAYSTLNLTLTETSSEEMVVVSENVGQRMQASFTRSVNATVRFFQDVTVFLAGAVIPLALILLLAAVGIAILRSFRRRSRESQQEKKEITPIDHIETDRRDHDEK